MKRFGLPKTCLLRKTGEFDQVYRRGRRLHGRGFTLVCMANDLPWNRLGISVHRKIGGAVRRNRIKRIIRETFRLHRDIFPPSSDIVCAVRPDFALDSPAAMLAAVRRLSEAGERVG